MPSTARPTARDGIADAKSTSGHALDALRAIVGAAHLSTGDGLRGFATDIFRAREMPVAMASPGTVDELQQLVRVAARAGLALVARGGGSSYTDGYLPTQAASLLIDLRRLDRIVEINAQDGYVTVEAGVTWAALADTLAERGLRTPFRGPFSGAVATVGGTMAQNGISHGTGAWGVAAASAVSLDVVLASGELLRTGSAVVGAAPFSRYYGPDLTGLFLGDCGAFGIKARVTLPLLCASKAFAAVSFGFDSFDAMHAGMRAAAREAVDDTHFGLDAAMIRGQLRRRRRWRDTLKIARGVFATAPGIVSAIGQLMRMTMAGERAMGASAYLAHYIVEGADAREVALRATRLRRAVLAHGREIANTIPTVMRAAPFERMFHVLGPKGERWVPVHGLLPHSRVPAFRAALLGLLALHKAHMDLHGVWIGGLFECVGPGAFMIELGLYWPDAPNDYHLTTLDNAALAALPVHASDPALGAWIGELRGLLIALFRAHGAAHFQLGKVYPYASALDDAGRSVAHGIKRALDPQGFMNPNVLGL
ncbi:hypothetical protein BH11PSE13_BH11PSE13_38310 [soil metagenome]